MCNYKDYQLKETTRVRESVEWARYYAYNALDTESPRVLMIGDSICNNYHDEVRKNLANCVNVSYWASSKCVTDPEFLRELEFHLESRPYQMITFNNGLHSLTTNETEWKEAYELALKYIQAKLPEAKLYVVLSTAMRGPGNDIVKRINANTMEIIEKTGLPYIDLFTPMDAIDKETGMSDSYHFRAPAVAIQAEIMANTIRDALKPEKDDLVQQGTETGPEGRLD